MAVPESHKKKSARTPPETVKPREVVPPQDDLAPFGQPIDTGKVRIVFDLEKKTITYTVKSTGEVLVKDYEDKNKPENIHALRIIYGRIIRDPEGTYTNQCIAKAKIATIKNTSFF